MKPYNPEQPSPSQPVIWSVAGSDSGGGAGIQADLATIQDLGGHACTVISAVTAQNSVQVLSVNPVSEQAFTDQLDVLAADMKADVIKIGLLPTSAHVEILASYLALFRAHWSQPPKVIYDPVAIASSGRAMADNDTLDAILTHLLPVVDLWTPNARELSTLTGLPTATPEQAHLALSLFLAQGANAVLLKGGHLDWVDGQCVDIYADAEREIGLASPRIATREGHGTGCTLASAIAVTLAQDYPMEDALVVAKAYLNQGLRRAYSVGQGPGPLARAGWPENPVDFPHVILPGTTLAYQTGLSDSIASADIAENQGIVPGRLPQQAFAKCDTQRLGLYPVVDSLAWLTLLLEQGGRTLQLRIKDKPDADVEAEIQAAIELGRRYQARLFINDYWQLAIKHGAYGVHLGQEDMETADLHAIAVAGLRLGLSTHGYYEILRAHAIAPSYIALGHIFPTKTKDMPSLPQGVARLARYVALMQDYPLVAIGGINLARAPMVARTGVGSIAVVTAITEAADPITAIADLRAIAEPEYLEPTWIHSSGQTSTVSRCHSSTILDEEPAW